MAETHVIFEHHRWPERGARCYIDVQLFLHHGVEPPGRWTALHDDLMRRFVPILERIRRAADSTENASWIDSWERWVRFVEDWPRLSQSARDEIRDLWSHRWPRTCDASRDFAQILVEATNARAAAAQSEAAAREWKRTHPSYSQILAHDTRQNFKR